MERDGFDRGLPRRRVAVAALALGLCLDLATTATGFHVGLVEANPAGVVVLSALGIYGLVAAKAAASAALVAQLGFCTRRFGRTEQTLAYAGCLTVAGVWLLAALWNTALIIVTLGGFQ